ncbi:MAG: hypothetical protein KFF68_05280 [Desulfosarcina sp.]|nr:hypothetical protein [Desulfosarcina sp.]
MLDYDYLNVICNLDLPEKYKKRPSLSVVQGISIGPGTCSTPPETGIWPDSPIGGGKSFRSGNAESHP